MNPDRIEYSQTGRVAVIAMRRAPVNAVDFDMIDALHAAFRKADADRSVGAIVLTSALPGMFCGGMDLKMVRGASGILFRNFLDRFYMDTLDLQHGLSKPTIAAVNGAARGAGMTLSITCDMVVAAEDASLGYPEINVGVLPAIHFVHLPRQAGRHHAFEHLFIGDPFTPAQGREMGLINHVVPADSLMDKALELGERLAAKSPSTMAIGRRAFLRANDTDYRRGVANQIEMMAALIETHDGQEGLNAFVEKRDPVWRGE